MRFPPSWLLVLLYPTLSLCAWVNGYYNRQYLDYSTFSLTPEAIADCEARRDATVANGKCFTYALCILDYLNNYELASANAGTTLLALIPPTIAALGSSQLTREKTILQLPIFSRPSKSYLQTLSSVVLLLVAGFAGAYSPGSGIKQVAGALQRHPSSHGEALRMLGHRGQTLEPPSPKQGNPDREKAHESYLPGLNIQSPVLRAAVLLLLLANVAAICYVWSIIGFRTVIVWACNVDFIVVLWASVRGAPLLIEYIILRLIRARLLRLRNRKRRTFGSTSPATVVPSASQAVPDEDIRISPTEIRWIGATFIAISVISYVLILLGTGILGSSAMMEGRTALMFFGLVPALYLLLFGGCFILE